MIDTLCCCDTPDRRKIDGVWECVNTDCRRPVSPFARELAPAPQSAQVALGYLPESQNRSMYAHWSQRRQAKQQLQRDLEIVLLACRTLPRPIPSGHVSIDVTLIVPDRRRRDLDNFTAPLQKSLGDALVNGGWLPDDTPEHLTYGAARFEHHKGCRATRVLLTWQPTA